MAKKKAAKKTTTKKASPKRPSKTVSTKKARALPAVLGASSREYDEPIEVEIIDDDHESDSLPAVQAEIVDEAAYRESDETVATEVKEELSHLPSAVTDGLAAYLQEIRRYPLLTKEQESQIAQRYKEFGDPKDAEILVTSNLRFVVKVAAEYARFGARLIDLIQEGNVGLMHAVKEFNPYKGVRLITYAVWWIRGYIQEYLMRQYSMVRIGTTQNQRKLFYRLEKEREKLDQEGLQPTVKLLSSRLGVTEEEVQTMQQRLRGRDVSLDQPIDDDSKSFLIDMERSDEESVDEVMGARESLHMLQENINRLRPDLSEKEIVILEDRLLSDTPKKLQEIGDEWGVTREAVRQMEARLINKIKKAFEESLATKIG